MPRYFGLDQLDRLIAERIMPRSGFFVEVGAHDGLSQTNSLHFEQNGWSGLLIEPIPDLYQKCRANRPACKVANFCCTSLDDPRTEITMIYAGLMSVVKGHKDLAEEDVWLTRGEELQNLQRYLVTVPAAPLAKILIREKINKVDLLIIDVEGYEIPLLNGIDYSTLRPRWIVCEDAYKEDVAELLLTRGYKMECTLLERRFTRDRLYADTLHTPQQFSDRYIDQGP